MINGANLVFSILTGIVVALSLLLLIGAGGQVEIGRYQMETLVRNNSTQIYVLDTATGAVKWVDHMDTPFSQLKGK